MTDIVRRTTNVGGTRSASSIDTIVIHTTESDSFEGVVNWLTNPASGVSIHKVVGVQGNIAHIARDNQIAWHVKGFNSQSLGIELVGFAGQSNRFWRKNRRKQLNRAARIVARWSLQYDIPIPKRKPTNGTGGVTSHAILNPWDRTDPGEGFPWRVFLLNCRLQRARIARRAPSTRRRWREQIIKWNRKP